jgi:WD40 repeat protein
VTDLQFSSNSKLVVFSADDSTSGILKTMEQRVDQIFSDHNKNFACTSISLNSNDSILASGSSEGELIVRNIKDNEIILRDHQIRSAITKTKFSPVS